MFEPEDLDDDSDLDTAASLRTARGKYGPMLDIEQLRLFSELVRECQALPPGPPGSPRAVYDSAVSRISTDSTPQLLLRLDTVDSPAVAWLIHCELTARNVPPVLRPRAPENSRQLAFLPIVADLYWIATRHREHAPLAPRLRGVFTHMPGSDEWHKLVMWVYRWNHGRSYRIAFALALTDDMRQNLATMPTRPQADDRNALRKAHSRIEDQLTAYAFDHPDKSCVTTAEDVVARQMKILRCFVLSGRSAAITADCLSTANGTMKRRAVTQYIERIKQRSGAAERVLCRVQEAKRIAKIVETAKRACFDSDL